MSDKKPSNKTAYARLSFMLVLTLATQAVTIFKSSRVAALFGTSVEMDAFNFINSVSGFVFSFMGAGVCTVLIPYMARERQPQRSINGFLTALYAVSILLMAVFAALCRPVLNAVGVYTGEFVDIASSLALIILLGQFMNTINSVSGAYLQCRNSFNLPKALTLGVTLGMTAIVYLYRGLDIYSYALFSFLLLLLEMAIQYGCAVRKGFHFHPTLPRKDSELKQMFRIFLPTVFGSGVYQITLMTDSVLSSGMGTGSISILGYANTISGMINTVVAGNIMTYLYPKIAAEIHTENGKKKIFQYMNLFAALMFTIVVLFIAAGYDAVRILFERGAFTSESTRGVFLCVLLYVMGAPISIMRDVVYRFFYANGNTKGTFYNGLFASLMNIALSVALARVIGLYGIVLGTTLTAVFSFASILARMKKTYGFDGNFRPFAVDLLKTLAAAAAAAAICLLLKCCLRMLPSLLASLICAAAGTAVFILVLLITKSRVFQVELG